MAAANNSIHTFAARAHEEIMKTIHLRAQVQQVQQQKMAPINKLMMALLATSSRALRPTGTRMLKVTKGRRMLQREGTWTPRSALDSKCSLDCPACGGDGCGVCGGGLLGARKQQVSLEVPIHASSSAYCGCGGLGCEMCGGGLLLAAAPKTRVAVHA